MVRFCAYPGCENKQTSWTPYRFHRIPSINRDLQQQWLVALSMDINTPTQMLSVLRVCSQHFSPEDYRPPPPNKKDVHLLKRNAVPRPKEEERELEIKSEKPTLTSQQHEDTAATPLKTPAVWSPLIVKEEERELEMKSEKPTLPSQQNEDTATPVKTPVVWSPLIVKEEEKELDIQSERPTLPSQLHEDTAATPVKTPVVLSPLKEEERELELKSEKPTLPIQQHENENTAATPVKTPVVWLPFIVKAAVRKLPDVKNAATVSAPAPTVIKQKEGSDSLPRQTVAWSPPTVQGTVTSLSAIQHDQPTQPREAVLGKRPAEDDFRSAISAKQSREAPPAVEKREIKVIQTGRCHRSKVLTGRWKKVGENLLQGKFKRLPKAIMEVPGFKDIMVAEVLKVLEKECEALTSLTFNSVLRENNPTFLKDFCWEKVIEEWETEAPTFLKFLQHASKVFENPVVDQTHMPKAKLLTMAMGGALLLRARSSTMCAPMYINSMILQEGGTKTKCFDQLNRVGVCVSHRRMQLRLKDVDTTQGSKLARWGEEIGQTEEMDTKSDDCDEEERGSTYEEGDSDVSEITYIVS